MAIETTNGINLIGQYDQLMFAADLAKKGHQTRGDAVTTNVNKLKNECLCKRLLKSVRLFETKAWPSTSSGGLTCVSNHS